MGEIARKDIVRVDLDKPLQRSRYVLSEGDDRATVFGAVLHRSGNAVDLTGATVKGFFIRGDGVTEEIAGTASGNMASVTLTARCYVKGNFTLSVKVLMGGVTHTVRRVDGYVCQTETDVVDGDVAISLTEAVERAEAAAERAEEAANNAGSSGGGGSATVTAYSIKTALGYTPADKTVTDNLTNKVATLEKEVANGITDVDKAAIAHDVLELIDASSVANVVVDENKNITLSGDLADGAYTLKYLNDDGSTTTICTLTISNGSGEGGGGSGGGDSGETDEPDTPVEPDDPDTPVVTPTGNLFVASTCTLNKRINSSGLEKDQDYTFLTDYIDIGDCLAQGGTNQIHFRDFWVYKMTADDVTSTGNNNLASSAYRGINYYDASGAFIGQKADYYVEDAVKDANGDYVITLDATMTTAAKIRVCGTLNAVLTSTDQLANCKITLNELITD